MNQTIAGQAAASQIEILPALQVRHHRIRGLPLLLLYAAVLLTFAVVGAFAPVLAPHDPNAQELVNRLHPPAWSGGDWTHPLGTDNLGRDVLSRLIYGTRISLIVVVTAIPLAMLFGVTLGLIAGFYRGWFDSVLMRIVDIQLALPAVLFAVLLASIYGAGLRNVLFIIIVWNWAGFARVVRAEILSLRERDFVIAARVLGAHDRRIMIRHLVPNVLNAVVVLVTLDVAAVILIEAGLSFLGVGVAAPTASWGSMVSEGRNYIRTAWWLVTVPGVAILLVSLTGNLLGDWLRDAIDPHLRNVR